MRRMSFVAVFRVLVLSLTAFLLPVGIASAFPDKSVNYVVSFNPGGESDIAARLQQPFFEEITGRQLVIKYQAGAGGAQAWTQLARGRGDGYTVTGTILPHIILQPLQQSVGYRTEDIVNVYFFHYTPDAVLVSADSPFHSLAELLDHARTHPGALTFSGSGSNSANHLAQRQLDSLAGVQTTYVPFSGTAPAVTAMLAGQVSASMGYSTIAVNQRDQVRMLAVATEERLPAFADVPTFRELGIDMVGGAYRGIGVPPSTPEAVRRELSSIFRRINQDPQQVARMEEAGFVVVDIPYEEAAGFVAERRREIEGLARSIGIASRD
jgi:tripartite-type tricarboxylate transporter receptor subunit TctC